MNFCIGSIIGIYPGHVLEKGAKIVAALYILYGPLTILTLTSGKGVHEFVLDDTGEFVLKEQNIRIPKGDSTHRRPEKGLSPGACSVD